MNRQQRRAAAAERRKAERRDDAIALAHQIVAETAAHDETLAGATLILPDGESFYIDAAMLRRGGRA